MDIYITNTASGKKEKFIPIEKEQIKFYACGPTVYDRAHLGNARAAVTFDLLFRLLNAIYPQVTYVRNITDVDDKIIKAAHDKKCSIKELTNEVHKNYLKDMASIGCEKPTQEPKATEHISEMIEMIENLIASGNAYVAEQHVLFDVSTYKDYGSLSGRNLDEMVAGSRVEIAPFKRNPHDFVLWKPAKPSEEKASFESPWGKGRPGWHIECSAMSKKYLGNTFDIHGGGVDLVFPHHENEIAQSTCANNCKFANYWVHNGFLTIQNEKMSKSLGNFKTVHDFLEAGISGAALRYLFLTTHYRKPLDLNDKAISDATKSVEKISKALSGYENLKGERDEEFLKILADDLNTPAALAYLHKKIASQVGEQGIKKLKYCLSVLGLKEIVEEFSNAKREGPIDDTIILLAEKRKEARLKKDWALADKLRDEIKEKGYEVKDAAKNNYELVKI